MLYFLIIFILIADQLSKLYIINNFYYGESIAIIDNILHITYVKNTGAAFGILKGKSEIFILITIVIITSLLYYRFKCTEKEIFMDMALALIIGGAIGNLIDRIRLKYVVDFIDLRVWPVFNIADSAVVVGAFLLIIYIYRFDI